jgi:oxygen-independent coproporphyrinogen-3 oxidase
MLGLYIHIPFCARRCPYCDFAIVAGASDDFMAAYVAALRGELKSTLHAARHGACAGRELTSIFFGGGTPSRLEAGVLASLLATVKENFPLATDAEITLEANPEDAAPGKLATLRAAGYNRISFGAQSFDESELKFLGRRHDAPKIEAAVRAARAAGFENISLDCIYALPDQTPAQWRSTLHRIVDLNVPHVSCYALTIEDGTAFGRRAARGVLRPLADDAQAEMMQAAPELLEQAGFERYEISNYARPGFRSIHNENYWRGGDYLACGNAVHGHLNGRRWWNERDPRRYVSAIQARGTALAGEEVLTPRQRLEEIVMLGLRTRAGFDLRETSEMLKLDARRELNGALEALAARGVLEVEKDHVRLHAEAMPVADAVAARLLI